MGSPFAYSITARSGVHRTPLSSCKVVGYGAIFIIAYFGIVHVRHPPAPALGTVVTLCERHRDSRDT